MNAKSFIYGENRDLSACLFLATSCLLWLPLGYNGLPGESQKPYTLLLIYCILTILAIFSHFTQVDSADIVCVLIYLTAIGFVIAAAVLNATDICDNSYESTFKAHVCWSAIFISYFAIVFIFFYILFLIIAKMNTTNCM